VNRELNRDGSWLSTSLKASTEGGQHLADAMDQVHEGFELFCPKKAEALADIELRFCFSK